MRILILVLSARRAPWDSMMDVSIETWDAEDHPQTKTLYYCGKGGSAPGHKLNPNWVAVKTGSDVLFSPTLTESLEDVSARTLEAFEFSLSLEWDFIARPHSSTYVHKRNLVEFTETLHRQNQLCGLLTTGPQPFLWGGGSYIISRDVIEQFVANKDKWNLGIMEDNSITNLANELGIPFNRGGRMASIDKSCSGYYICTVYGCAQSFTFTDFADIKQAHPHFYFRCKQDHDRSQDLMIMRHLHEHYR